MKQKLIDLLKTVPEIKKDLEELKFGCRVRQVYNEKRSYKNTYIHLKEDTYCQEDEYDQWDFYDKFEDRDLRDEDIIWHPIEERHLRMYCESKYILLLIAWNWSFCRADHEGWYENLWFKLDNTKSFNDQTEEVYTDIVEFLESNK